MPWKTCETTKFLQIPSKLPDLKVQLNQPDQGRNGVLKPGSWFPERHVYGMKTSCLLPVIVS